MAANDIFERKQAVAELQRVNKFLDTILEAAPVGFCFVDRDLCYVRINERLAQINGIPADAHLGRPVSEVVPALAETLREVTGRILATGEAVLNYEFSGETPAAPGVTRFWCEHWYPVRDVTGEIIGFGGIVEDITERRLAEEALRASEERVHQVIDSMFTFVGMIAPDGTLTEANHASLAAAGLSRSDVIGKPFWDCYWWNYDPAVRKRLRAGFDRAVRGEVVRYEETIRVADDQRAVLDFVLKPVFDGDRLLFVIPSAENITWRKQAEAERKLREADRASEGERLTRFFEQAPSFMAMLDGPDHVFQRANDAYLRLVGRQNVVGRPVRDSFPDVSGQGFFELLDQVYASGKAFVGRNMSIAFQKDGGGVAEQRFLDFVYQPIFGSDGKVSGIFVDGHDVTEHRRNEVALQEGLNEIEALYANTPVGLALLDRDLRYVRVNNAHARINGVAQSDHIGRFFWEILPTLRDSLEPKLLQVLQTGEIIEFEAMGETPAEPGITRVWKAKYYPLTHADGSIVAVGVAVEDVTERRRAEAAMRASEARFRGTFENAAVGVAHVALDGGWLRVNEKLCSIVGYSREELLTMTFQDITHPDDLDADLAQQGQVLSGEVSTYAMDKRYIRKDGSEIWIALTVSLQRLETGEPDHFISVIVDISAQKDAEAHREFLMRELAHRAKNQLAVVQGVASQTARSAGSLDEFRELFGNRLQGMAISADLLVAQQWDGTPLEDLVRRHLEPFGTAGGRLVCEGPDVFLGSNATESIGLAFHELATNCVKYGAWSVPTGVVRVSWTLDSDGAQPPQLQVDWTERGGPAVTPPTREGFGRRVIERMVAQKLGGTVNSVFSVEGLSWTLKVPATQFMALPREGGSQPF
jgi:PAS domain S-box-containing protein